MNVVIDYDTGNIGSLLNMLKKAGAPAVLSREAETIRKATRLFLPGVGAFDTGMGNLNSLGLLPVLEERVLGAGVPILGICLGFQLLTKSSEEGVLPGLGWLDAETIALRKMSGDPALRTPHMGWNHVEGSGHPLTEGLDAESRFYFVHTYGVDPATCREQVIFTTTYGCRFVSAAARGHIMGTQFHPEKSHKFGLRLLKNFLERC